MMSKKVAYTLNLWEIEMHKLLGQYYWSIPGAQTTQTDLFGIACSVTESKTRIESPGHTQTPAALSVEEAETEMLIFKLV